MCRWKLRPRRATPAPAPANPPATATNGAAPAPVPAADAGAKPSAPDTRTAAKTDPVPPPIAVTTKPVDTGAIVPVSTGGAKAMFASTATNVAPGLRFRMILEGPDGKPMDVDPARDFHTGDRIKFAFESNVDGYLYVAQQGTSGNWTVLFPHPDINGGRNKVERFVEHEVPNDNYFRLQGNPGQEHIFVFLSREPMKTLPGFDRPVKALRERLAHAGGHARAEHPVARSHPRKGQVVRRQEPAGDLHREQGGARQVGHGELHAESQAMRRLLAVVIFAAGIGPLFAQAPGTPGTPTQAPRDLVLAPNNKPLAVREGVPRGYALIVGVARYKNLEESKQLRFPETDADAMYRVLINHEGGAFPAENVKFLKGDQATLANIKYHLEEWLPKVAQPMDRVVVYFAGHGFVQNGKGYLAPWDVDPDKLESTAYPMATVGDVLANKVGANWKVLLTDACHSGKINAETTNEALEQQFSALPRSFLTLTATTEREQSFEDPNLSTGFGFFTYYLVQAFRGYADVDPCDGRITADELIEYVRTNVRRYARERQLSQTPTARGDYEPEMLLGVANACLSDGSTEAPSMLGTAVIESNMDDVDVYLDGKLIGRMSKGKPLVIPSLPAGLHEFQGVREGYEPDRKEIMVAPGQESAVSFRIRYVRQIKKPAQALNEQGEKLLFTRRSSLSLLNLVPVERKQSEADLNRAAACSRRRSTSIRTMPSPPTTSAR